MNPTDGFISVEELTRWNWQQAMNAALHRTEREFETHDEDRDGFVSFSEYEPPSWVMAAGRSSSFFIPHFSFGLYCSLCSFILGSSEFVF